MKRVKTRVFLAMKNGVYLPPKQHDVIKLFIAANKTKGKLKAKTTDAARKAHNA
jgi:hypothetical protein